MTEQEIFNRVAEGIVAQGNLAKEGINCCYRTSDGLKCAAGQLIDDAEYNYDMEGKFATSSKIAPILHKKGIDINFVKELQVIHDSSPDMQTWRNRMRSTAERHNLEVPQCLM